MSTNFIHSAQRPQPRSSRHSSKPISKDLIFVLSLVVPLLLLLVMITSYGYFAYMNREASPALKKEVSQQLAFRHAIQEQFQVSMEDGKLTNREAHALLAASRRDHEDFLRRQADFNLEAARDLYANP